MKFLFVLLVVLLVPVCSLTAADAILVHNKVIPNVSKARHIEPILDAANQLEGFILSDTAIKALRLVWIDGRPEDTIPLPAWPHRSVSFHTSDSLFIYVFADNYPYTSYGADPRLVRIARADDQNSILEVSIPLYNAIPWEEYEQHYSVYENIKLVRDDTGRPIGVIVEVRVYWQGYIFTIGPHWAIGDNGLCYSLDLSDLRFRTPCHRVFTGHFVEPTSAQWAVSAEYEESHADEWCYLCDDVYSHGSAFGILDSSGVQILKYGRSGAVVSNLFAGDFVATAAGDETIFFGNLPVIEHDLPDTLYRACYSFAGGTASRLWYHPREATFSHWSFLVRFHFEPQNVIVCTQRSSAYFINCGSGVVNDSVTVSRPLDYSQFYQTGEGGAVLEVVSRRSDTLFVYRFDAITDVDDETDPSLPEAFTLAQNYPNPFNASTEIRFSLPRASEITLTIYNLLGQEVKTIASGRYTAGEHRISWDGTDNVGNPCATGIYLYRLATDNSIQAKKMLLLK